MPPGQKDTIGKKGRDPRQSRSRNTTPGMGRSSVPPPESGETAYLELSKRAFRTSDDIVEQHVAPIPSSKELELLLERLQRLVEAVDARGAVCDRGMRVLSKMRRERLEEIEEEKRAADRLKRDAAEEEERSRNKANSKKRKDASRAAEERPLTHGAHGVAPQDGSNLGTSIQLIDI
jgi:transcriptional adapter 3